MQIGQRISIPAPKNFQIGDICHISLKNRTLEALNKAESESHRTFVRNQA